MRRNTNRLQALRVLPMYYDPCLHAGSDAYPGVSLFMRRIQVVDRFNSNLHSLQLGSDRVGSERVGRWQNREIGFSYC
jgi:hypothetical protein